MNEKKCFILSVITLLCVILFSVVSVYNTIEFINECNKLIDIDKFKEKNCETENEEYQKFEKEIVPEPEPKNEPEKIEAISKKSLGEFRLTAYCSCEKCCGRWALNRPKDENGKDIVYGSTGEILIAGKSIAVDPDVIPYGSEIEINGTRYIAHDCGGAIKGNRIDVYFDDHQSALEFGVQYKEVFLIVG